MKSEFYIGYLDKAPKGIAAHVKKAVLLLVVLILLLAWLLASQQRGFAGSTYEFAEETSLTGVLTNDPVPAIILYQGVNDRDESLAQMVPIVAFGKVGGQKLMEHWSSHVNNWVALKGNLIYYEGKALIEVKDPNNLTVESSPGVLQAPAIADTNLDNGTFVGEIMDAKCYFGVMKPGHGKPHRSCAIRCISGGIPAVLKVKDKLDRIDYHLISMNEGSGRDLATRIGETVEVKGMLSQYGDWSILKIDNHEAVTPISQSALEFPSQLTMCE